MEEPLQVPGIGESLFNISESFLPLSRSPAAAGVLTPPREGNEERGFAAGGFAARRKIPSLFPLSPGRRRLLRK